MLNHDNMRLCRKCLHVEEITHINYNSNYVDNIEDHNTEFGINHKHIVETEYCGYARTVVLEHRDSKFHHRNSNPNQKIKSVSLNGSDWDEVDGSDDICQHCGSGDIVYIDKALYPIITQLNEMDITTLYSCIGGSFLPYMIIDSGIGILNQFLTNLKDNGKIKDDATFKIVHDPNRKIKYKLAAGSSDDIFNDNLCNDVDKYNDIFIMVHDGMVGIYHENFNGGPELISFLEGILPIFKPSKDSLEDLKCVNCESKYQHHTIPKLAIKGDSVINHYNKITQAINVSELVCDICGGKLKVIEDLEIIDLPIRENVEVEEVPFNKPISILKKISEFLNKV